MNCSYNQHRKIRPDPGPQNKFSLFSAKRYIFINKYTVHICHCALKVAISNKFYKNFVLKLIFAIAWKLIGKNSSTDAKEYFGRKYSFVSFNISRKFCSKTLKPICGFLVYLDLHLLKQFCVPDSYRMSHQVDFPLIAS